MKVRWVERVCVDVVVERGTCIALLQSHVEWREYSWLVSVYSVVPGANLKGRVKSWLVSNIQLVRSISCSWYLFTVCLCQP